MLTSWRRSRLFLFGLFGLVLSVGPITARAAETIEVNSLADPGTNGCDTTECTLREAIAAAQAGDTITFAARLFANGPGTIRLTGGELVFARELTLQGPGRRRLQLHGNRASRVMSIEEDAVVTITGLTITRGRCECDGGGIFNAGTLTLAQSTVHGNAVRENAIFLRSGRGGGLYNIGSAIIDHSTFSGNSATYGGGLHNGGYYRGEKSGTMTVTNSIIKDNKARLGGGLATFKYTSEVTITDSIIKGNTARYDGGGLLGGLGYMGVARSSIRSNTAGRQGGGLYGGQDIVHSTINGNTASQGGGLYGGQDIVRSTISGNTASQGGGLYGDPDIVHSTISGNIAHRAGGGLYSTGFASLSSSTISGNTAGRAGGGLYKGLHGSVSMRSTILAGNIIASEGTDADCSVAFPKLISRGHNLVGTDTGCPLEPGLGDLSVDPAVVFTQVLGPLQNNGGLTYTHALLPGSPAVDKGDPERCRGTDQRGVSRPQGVTCDIGAFELEIP